MEALLLPRGRGELYADSASNLVSASSTPACRCTCIFNCHEAKTSGLRDITHIRVGFQFLSRLAWDTAELHSPRIGDASGFALPDTNNLSTFLKRMLPRSAAPRPLIDGLIDLYPSTMRGVIRTSWIHKLVIFPYFGVFH